MANITVVASITAKTDKVDFVKEELLKLHQATHANDEGCIQYDLHFNNENPAHFVVFEIWESAELLQKHAEAKHFQDFVAATDGACEALIVDQLTRFA
ncbi:antibiotic biosynthesis monooxygenase [Vibrio sp. JC009]|uniref:putative quinol monooxygenase n=1 Tax=Vibrio sp. JC009 TaxID=2912314 RepID=UPI0023B00468|nr:putative quinol monooxygenase [Vibrio sp. JC009]WED23731.1 antibiotic biosynthesis monooxygenase [Vibrio sp. JC009]